MNPLLSNVRLVQQFSDYILLERGLSKNTLAAYTSDLRLFANWLGKRDLILAFATRTEIMDYLSCRLKDGASSRSSARATCTDSLFEAGVFSP